MTMARTDMGRAGPGLVDHLGGFVAALRGAGVPAGTSESIDALYRSELKRWDALIKAAGIKVE